MGDEDMDRVEHDLLSRVTEDVSELKKNERIHDDRIRKLETNDALQDHDIQGMKTTLGKIEENTTWLRRTLGKALITAVVAAFFSLIGGIVLWIITH